MVNPNPLLKKVVSAFPGTGKSHLFRTTDLVVLDSDSSKFSWLSEGVRNPAFPANYMDHIRENLDTADIVLVSSHAEVRQALVEAGIEFALVYPRQDLKEEYLARYAQRGSPPEFIRNIDLKWDEWQRELFAQRGCTHIILGPGQYLSDLYK